MGGGDRIGVYSLGGSRAWWSSPQIKVTGFKVGWERLGHKVGKHRGQILACDLWLKVKRQWSSMNLFNTLFSLFLIFSFSPYDMHRAKLVSTNGIKVTCCTSPRYFGALWLAQRLDKLD